MVSVYNLQFLQVWNRLYRDIYILSKSAIFANFDIFKRICNFAGFNILAGGLWGTGHICNFFRFFRFHYTAILQILLNGAGYGVLSKSAIFAKFPKVSIKLKTLGSIYSLQCLQISDTAILQILLNEMESGVSWKPAIFAGLHILDGGFWVFRRICKNCRFF